MNKQLIKLLLLLLFLSCNRPDAKKNLPAFAPETTVIHGCVIPSDSISEPHLIVAGKPRVIVAGKPVEVPASENIVTASGPLPVSAEIPEASTPGEKGLSLPRVIVSTAVPILSGIPEVVLAKNPGSKDINPKNFHFFGTTQGLKHNQIRCLIQDRNGNLWFSNDDGVTRFDGKYLSHFSVKSGLSNSIVLSIMEDREGTLWFGTFGGGVTRYDGKYFTHFTEKDGLSSNIVNWMIQDKAGNYWFATSGGGATKFDGKVFTQYTSKEGIGSDLIRTIIEDDRGNIWFGTFGNGITRFDGTSFYNYSPRKGFVADHIVSSFIDLSGNIWFGTYKYGAIKYDGKSFYQYSKTNGLINNHVLCMMQDSNKNMWFGTSGGGISKFDGANFIQFTETEGLTNNYVRCCLTDKDGNIWFGTRDGGLNRYNGDLFTHFSQTEGLSNNKVLNIFQDKQKNYWFGTFDGGITKFDGKKYTSYSKEQGLLNDRVYQFTQDEQGQYWFCSDGGGVTRFDGKSFFHYTQDQGLCHNSVRSIYFDRHKNLWICTYGGGVSKFDGKTFTNYSKQSGLTSDQVFGMLQDRKGNYWFGTDEGITQYDGEKFTHFTQKEGIGSNSVPCILEDKDGNLWFGTSGSGVICYDGKKFTAYTEKEGLTNNYITSILQDKKGNIWLGTRLGPNILENGKLQQKALNPEIPLFKSYTYEDGFLGIGCNFNAIMEDMDETIWIGATNRLTAIHPKAVQPNSHAPNIQLANVQLYNNSIDWLALENKKDTVLVLSNGVKVSNLQFTGTSYWYFLPEHLSLAYNNNFLTFQYIGISHKQTDKINYQYLLEGFDPNWSAITNRTEVSYGNLKPGKYRFRVKAMNSEGQWSNEYQYAFIIRPPWWKTWWFYLLVVISSGAIIFTYITRREYNLKQQKLFLQHKVDEQTLELKQTNEKLQDKNEELQTTNSEKDKFFSIISHDVRGPLSSFLQLTEIMAEGLNSYSLNEIQQINEAMRSSASNILELLGNLLEWARMQRGLIDFNPELLSISNLLTESMEMINQSAHNKSITITVDLPEELSVMADKNMIGSVIRNLTSNAVKFTKKGGKVNIKAQKTENNSIKFSVSDTGIGMNEEVVNNLFRIDTNNRRQGTEGEPSTGLGLLLCKDFVEKHGGRIWAESEVGKGSTFYFTINAFY